MKQKEVQRLLDKGILGIQFKTLAEFNILSTTFGLGLQHEGHFCKTEDFQTHISYEWIEFDKDNEFDKAGIIHGGQVKAVEKDGVLSCPNCGDIFEQYSEAFKHSCSCHQNLEKENSKEFSSRFMPNVKFKVSKEYAIKIESEFKNRDVCCLFSQGYCFYETDSKGELVTFVSRPNSCNKKEVDIFQAIPQFIPEHYVFVESIGITKMSSGDPDYSEFVNSDGSVDELVLPETQSKKNTYEALPVLVPPELIYDKTLGKLMLKENMHILFPDSDISFYRKYNNLLLDDKIKYFWDLHYGMIQPLDIYSFGNEKSDLAGVIHESKTKAIIEDDFLICPDCREKLTNPSDALSHSCDSHQNSEKEKSDSFDSRFMPNVKFKADTGDNLQNRDIELFLLNIKELFISLDAVVVDFVITSSCGEYLILCTEKAYNLQVDYKEVSIYEAIPELVPEGMRYSKVYKDIVPLVFCENQIEDGLKRGLDIIVEYYRLQKEFDDSKSDSDGIIHKDYMLDTFPFYKGYFDDILKSEKKEDSKPNGFVKHDSDKIRYDLVCPYAYEDLGKVLTFGAKKYSENNWMKGDINTYIAAMERHLSEIKKAVNDNNKDLFTDKDSGLQHGSALMVNSMFIHYFIRKNLEEKKC